jgi:hypothetical protein
MSPRAYRSVTFSTLALAAIACNGLLGLDGPVVVSSASDASSPVDGTAPPSTGDSSVPPVDASLRDAPAPTPEAGEDTGPWAIDAGGSGCTDIALDSKNCGACGHDCLGQTCNTGICAATPVGQVGGPGIAVDATYVYWTSPAGGGVMRATKNGTSVTRLATAGAPVGIAVQDSLVYFADQDAGTVQVAASDAAVATIFPNGRSPWAVAVEGNALWWTDAVDQPTASPQSIVFHWSLDPNNPDGGKVKSGLTLPQGIAVYGGIGYFTDTGTNTVWSSVGPTVLSTNVIGSPYGIAVDATGVYVTSRGSDGQVSKLTHTGGTPTSLTTSNGPGTADPRGIAVKDGFVYWVCAGTTPNSGSVFRVSVNGGTPLELATGQPEPEAIAVDDQYVYWTTTGGTGSVMRVAK